MIKEKRKLKNYTQENMAELLNISLRQYVRIDKEEDLPRRDVLKNLITMLDLTDEEIGEYIRGIVNNKYA
ncbi:MAG: helix-turn-helix transcriptional regulator [Clostridia bacterium]|nr:helix-turn-helix transcriptional regulator [Clostridia bacterium]